MRSPRNGKILREYRYFHVPRGSARNSGAVQLLYVHVITILKQNECTRLSEAFSGQDSHKQADGLLVSSCSVLRALPYVQAGVGKAYAYVLLENFCCGHKHTFLTVLHGHTTNVLVMCDYCLWCRKKQSDCESPVWQRCSWHSWQYHCVSRLCCCRLCQQNQQRPLTGAEELFRRFIGK